MDFQNNANANNAAVNNNGNQGGDNQPVMFPQPAEYYANQQQHVQAAIQHVQAAPPAPPRPKIQRLDTS